MCRACFASLPEGSVRVTAITSGAGLYYHLAKQVRVACDRPTGGSHSHPELTSRVACAFSPQFYHLNCKPPKCDAAAVAGLQQLSPKDRDAVAHAMAQ
jgi:hypothetical protein